MHFDFGQAPAGVTDRMIVFDRHVGEYETSSGEALGVQVKSQDTPVDSPVVHDRTTPS